MSRVRWPDGRGFAFSVFDDTDRSTLENAPRVYDLLGDLGFLTTKSVWPLPATGDAIEGGATCEDAAYAAWAQALQRGGFEIALHNVAPQTSTREQTIRGMERFGELFGGDSDRACQPYGLPGGHLLGRPAADGPNQTIYNLLNRNADPWHLRGSYREEPALLGRRLPERGEVRAELRTPQRQHARVLPADAVPRPEAPLRQLLVRVDRGPERRRVRGHALGAEPGSARGRGGRVHHVHALRVGLRARRASRLRASSA